MADPLKPKAVAGGFRDDPFLHQTLEEVSDLHRGGPGPEPPGGQPDISITETLNWLKRRFHVEGGVWWLDGREDPAPFTAMWLMDRLYLNNRVINSDYGQDSKYGNRAGHLCEACGSPSSPFLSTCQLIRPIVETSAASGVP